MEGSREKNMQTIVYLIRHSKKIDNKLLNRSLSFESSQILNEKTPLGIEGEKKAKGLSEYKEFEDVDVIYSSNYTRAIQTAQYLAEKRKIKINIDERFNERKHGIYEGEINLKKYYQEDFKNPEGESPKEVRNRMFEAFENAVNNNLGKKITIFTHGAAMTFLLMKWCKLENIENNKRKTLSYNDKIIVDKIFDQPEIFKLILDDKGNLIEVSNLELKL